MTTTAKGKGAHQQVRLKYLASINDDTLSETTAPDFEMFYVDIGGVDSNEGIISVEETTFGAAPSRARRIVKDGDTIVSTVRTYLRAIAPIRSPRKNLIVSTGFAVVRPRKVDSAFLSYALRASAFVETIVARSVGVSYPAINAAEIGTISIPVPPSDVQRQIAAFLDRKTTEIDRLIAKKRALIERLGEERVAIISHAVTKGLDQSVPMKPSGVDWLGDIPLPWECAPLFTALQERDVRNTRGQEANVLSLSYGHIVPRDISDNFGLLPESFETYQIVEPGNIVLRLTDLQNDKKSLRVGLVEERGIITSAYVALNVTAKLHSPYAFYLLHAYDITKVFYALGAGVRQTMKFADLKRMPLLVPPEAEQRAISAFLDRETARIDNLVRTVQDAIARLLEFRSALISAAVTGQIDVRGVA